MPFFQVTASKLKSKWSGESEKLVDGLYMLAEVVGPSIIFFGETTTQLVLFKDIK